MKMMQYKSTIEKNELNELPVETFEGNIHVIDSEEQTKEAVSYLMQQPILGFDTETRPSFVKGDAHTVALMQISDENECFLFRLNQIGIPESLIKLLRTTKVKKIGLSTKDDFRALRIIKEDLKPLNFIELQNYVPQFGIEEMSLSKIYALLFNKRISKGQRLTNWEADELSAKQQQYAALDAYATRRIYVELELQIKNGYPIKEIKPIRKTSPRKSKETHKDIPIQ
jgi:ribonuclease D